MGWMDLSQLLKAKGIEPGQVLVLRHAPPPLLTNILPMWALERPELYNAYQQTQGDRAEASMKKAGYVASFIGMNSHEALFVGLYQVVGNKPLSQAELWSLPTYKAMESIGLRKISAVAQRERVLLFDLELIDWYGAWKGKLVIDWPPSRSWARWADRNDFPVKAILPESALAKPLQGWNELVLSYADVQNLPASWRIALAMWAGVYLVFDTSDRKPYIGSARGVENILGRWMDYANGKNGGNKLLQGRDPKNFEFSILERTVPEIPGAELIALENRWKTRLHARHPHGLNAN
jgi:hypothetical protein